MEAGFCRREISGFGESSGLELEAGEKSVTELGTGRGEVYEWGKLERGQLEWEGSYSRAGAFFALRLLFGILLKSF